MKVENNFGGYSFFARVIDREGDLQFAAEPPKQGSLKQDLHR